MNNPQYENLSKQELQERLAKADKGSERLSKLLLLAYFAFMVWINKDLIVSLLIKAGATDG